MSPYESLKEPMYIIIMLCSKYFIYHLLICCRVLDADACPMTYRVALTVFDFSEAHSGTFTVTIMNRANSVSHNYQRILEG